VDKNNFLFSGKNIAQVSDGGFIMDSDGLSGDFLEQVKAQAAEILKAKGIDAAMVAGLSSDNVNPSAQSRRRNPPPRKDHPASSSNSKKKGAKA
jgi:hypothetical protein